MTTITRIVSTRDGMPAVNVKDHTAWAHDHRTSEIIGQLSESVVERIYEQAQEQFWFDAEAIAVGFGYQEIGSAGRSGGWLTVSGTTFLEYLDADDPWSDDGDSIVFADRVDDDYTIAALKERDHFLEFARQIELLQESAEKQFVAELTWEWEDESNIERGRD